MTLLEAVGLILTAVGGFASVFGLFYFRVTHYNGERTRELMRELQAETRALLERMDLRAEEARREVAAAFERMDRRSEEAERRASERHGEAFAALKLLAERR